MMLRFKKYINKFNDLPITAKASIVYLLASLLQKGLGFITSPIFTRILSADQYGEVSVYLSTEQIIGTIAMFCLSAGYFDIGMQEHKNDRNTFVFSLLILSNVITIITGLIILFLYPVIGRYINVDIKLLGIMFLTFLLQPALIFWTRHQRFEYLYKKPAIVTCISSVISSTVAVLAVLFTNNNKTYARIIGATVPLLICYLCCYFYIAKRSKLQIKFSYWKNAFLFNLPLIPHYLSSYILNSSDRLMIAYLVGNAEAGYYSLAYSIAAIVTLLWSAINSSLVPFVLDKYEKKQYNIVSQTVMPILTLFAILCFIIIMLAPEAIRVLGTTEYLQAVYVIPPIIGGVFFQALYYIFTNVLYYYKKPHYVMMASISTGLLNIVLNYIFILKFGFIAAGYTTLVCYMIQALLDYFISRKVVGIDIFDKRYLLTLSLFIIIVSLVSNLLYSGFIIRYLIILFAIIIIFTKRKYFYKILLTKDNNLS